MKRFLGILVILLTSWNFTFAAIDYSVGGITLNEILKTPLDSVKVVLVKNGVKLDSTYSSMTKVNGKMRAYFKFNKMTPGTYQCQGAKQSHQTLPQRRYVGVRCRCLQLSRRQYARSTD